MKKAILIFIVMLGVYAFAACSQKSPTSSSDSTATITNTATNTAVIPGGTVTVIPTSTPNPSGNLSGTLTLPAAASGKQYNITIVANISDLISGGTTYHATGVCGSNTTVSYGPIAVPTGTYFVIAVVDTDNSGQAPTVGDYIGVHGTTYPTWPGAANVSITNTDPVTADVTLVAATNNLSGTLTLPAAIPGRTYVVILDNDTDGSNGYITTKYGVCGTGVSVNYSMLSPLPGNYYLYAIVDITGFLLGGGGPTNGDYLGFYGGDTPATFLANPNINDIKNITLNIIGGTPVSTATPIYTATNTPIPSATVPTVTQTPSVEPTSTPNPSGNLSGTLTLPAASSGKSFTVTIASSLSDIGTGSSTYDFKGTRGAGTAVSYGPIAVPTGTYYVISYVDKDNSGGGPNAGDYIGIHGTTYPTFPGAANVNITNADPVTADITLVTGTNNLSGTLTLPYDAPGKTYVVILDTDTDGSNGYLAVKMGICGASTSVNYNMLCPLPGYYHLYAAVDITGFMEGGGGPTAGDYFGYYVDASTTFLVTPASNDTKNITLNIITP